MKKLITLFILLMCVGCTPKIINVNGTKNEETTSFNAFNDESYVWENWSFSTNKVNNLK